MSIRPVSFTPSFKGFILSPDDKTAVNAKYITSMKEFDDKTAAQKRTEVMLTDKTYRIISAPLDSVLTAYTRAAASEVYVVKVKKDESNK